MRQTTVEYAFAKDDQFQLPTSCLPGGKVTGGGGRSSNGRVSLSESIPFVSTTSHQWGVLLHNTSSEALTAQVTTYVICASS